MRLKILFCGLLTLIACTPELLKLASQYQNNLLAVDKLQKEFRKILSFCEYDNECFEEDIKDYIIDEVCIEPDYKDYGFLSILECDKFCFPLADEMIKSNRYDDLGKDYFKIEREQKKQERAIQRYYDEQRKYERERQVQQLRYEAQRDYELHKQQAEQMQRQAEQWQNRQAYIENCQRLVDAEIEGRIADEQRQCIDQRLSNRSRYGQLSSPCRVDTFKYNQLRTTLKLQCRQ